MGITAYSIVFEAGHEDPTSTNYGWCNNPAIIEANSYFTYYDINHNENSSVFNHEAGHEDPTSRLLRLQCASLCFLAVFNYDIDPKTLIS